MSYVKVTALHIRDAVRGLKLDMDEIDEMHRKLIEEETSRIGEEVKRYESLPWWKRLFTGRPSVFNIYEEVPPPSHETRRKCHQLISLIDASKDDNSPIYLDSELASIVGMGIERLRLEVGNE